MVRIKDLAFIGYPVTDVTRARAFYEGVLGLASAMVFEHEGRHWIEYPTGSATLAISNMSVNQWRPSSDGPCAAFEVEDFDAAVAVLRRAGVKFALPPFDSGVCRMAIVHDPDGNSVTIHQRRPS